MVSRNQWSGAGSAGRWSALLLLAGGAILGGCDDGRRSSDTPLGSTVPLRSSSEWRVSREPIAALMQAASIDRRKVELGDTLFHDRSLSGNGTVSCASCHDLANGGDDGKPRSEGANGDLTSRNSPTVFNASLNFAQFWDGRADRLETQISGPIENAKEMDSDWGVIVNYLAGTARYKDRFETIYPDGVTQENAVDALASFVRSLETPNSRFDRYLVGEEDAITAEELEGYQLFKSFGCVSCHQGQGVGGNMFQKFGVFGNPYEDGSLRTEGEPDLGRYHITEKDEDRYVFKVPSLRNVALTAPYFHDGSVAELEDAIRIMIRYQLGREPSERNVSLLKAFLHTLTGEYRGRPLQ